MKAFVAISMFVLASAIPAASQQAPAPASALQCKTNSTAMPTCGVLDGQKLNDDCSCFVDKTRLAGKVVSMSKPANAK